MKERSAKDLGILWQHLQARTLRAGHVEGRDALAVRALHLHAGCLRRFLEKITTELGRRAAIQRVSRPRSYTFKFFASDAGWAFGNQLNSLAVVIKRVFRQFTVAAPRCEATFAAFPKGRPWLTQASASWPLLPARDGPDTCRAASVRLSSRSVVGLYSVLAAPCQ